MMYIIKLIYTIENYNIYEGVSKKFSDYLVNFNIEILCEYMDMYLKYVRESVVRACIK